MVQPKMIFLTLILASMDMLGCIGGQQEQNVTNETQPPPPPPVKTPTFAITNPTQNQVIVVRGDTADVSLTLTTQNLLLRQPGGAAKKGEGYFKVTIDDQNPVTLTSKNYVMSALGIGEHTVKVELLNNDKTSYSPKISKEVKFTVEKEKPAEYVPQSYTVTITSSGYDPATLNVKVSDSVTFVNNAAMPHSATCFIAGKQVFDTGVIGPGKSATITVGDVYSCDYYSTMFRALTGHIDVQSNGNQ